ncbi:MAG TPA: RNA polymerase sigma factor SigJ [Gemmatimonadaceae bacterium]|nr:RNA polymerase sigma factor SigJ [Gemmatimonadaceae bacterium]
MVFSPNVTDPDDNPGRTDRPPEPPWSGVTAPRDQLLEELRPRAFDIAYGMLGSVAEAEDVVQEALLRVHTALEKGEQIESPVAYAATVTSRLAIDELRSARARRESYIGDRLPEPLVTGPADDASHWAEMSNSLSIALLVLLESLSPEQRAAFLLRDVFDYAYDEIAAVIGTSETNARQLATWARRHVAERRPRFEVSREKRDQLAQRFFAAVREGDLAGIESLLAEDVVLRGDGGGKVPMRTRAVHGRIDVARAMYTWATQRIAGTRTSMRYVEINGEPGALLLDGNGRLLSVTALDIAGEHVLGVTFVVNPDKLRHIAPLGDARVLGARHDSTTSTEATDP